MILDGLVDAQEMGRTYPETFETPTSAELSSLEKGSVVKICRNEERFWVIVTEIDGESIRGRVNNHLVSNDDLPAGTPISFEMRHIFIVGDELAEVETEQEEFNRRADAMLLAVRDADPNMEMSLYSMFVGMLLASFDASNRKAARRELIADIDRETKENVIRGCDA